MKNFVKVSAVSYLNSKPFIYGLLKSGLLTDIDLSTDIPSVCAQNLINQTVDIGLIPVAVLPSIREARIISDYCIGSDGPVNTVMLYSEVPLKEIKQIFLDYQSKTSVGLVRILAKNHWEIHPEYIPARPGYEKLIGGTSAGLVIGDRAFEMNLKFPFVYDLSKEWKKYTGLPFVFACWVTNKILSDAFLKKFNASLKYGLDNIDQVIIEGHFDQLIRNYPPKVYFEKYIHYEFDELKKKAMNLYLKLLKEI